MLIAIDGLPLTAPKTGVGHYTFELARALANLQPSSQFEIIYPSSYPLITPAAVAGAGDIPANLKLARVSAGLIGRHWWSAGLPRYVRKRKLDLFHGTNYDVPMWRQCATVLTIHDLSHLLHPETHEKESVSRARRRLPLMARTADAIITPSESVRGEVCERLKASPEKVFAIPEAARACFHPLPFADTEDVRQRLGVGDDFLLTVGTLEPRKNLGLLVSAFAEVARALPQNQTKLIIAGGRGWLSGPLFTTIERSPVRQRIVLTGYLHDEDLRALYSSCHAFIYPSLYEGFGLPPLEAMTCGAPVIASKIASLKQTTGGVGLFFDPTSVGELAQCILDLLSNENARQELSIAGQRHAAEFSWERTARESLQVYAKAAKRYAK